jgi:hypothetical protein
MRDADIFRLSAVDLVAENPPAGRAVRKHRPPATLAFAAEVTHEISTRSPGLNAVTARPTCSTTPTPSWPRMRPRWQLGRSPLRDVQVGAANCRFRDLDDRIRWCGNLRLGMVFKGFFACPSMDQGLYRQQGGEP